METIHREYGGFFFVYHTFIVTSRAVTHGIHADGERGRRKPCCPYERHIAVEGSTLRRIVQLLISVPVLNANAFESMSTTGSTDVRLDVV